MQSNPWLSRRYRRRWYAPQLCPTPSVFTRRLGWALTLLSEENLSYASTCQTIGLNTGFFASFTVFLALNSEAFRYTCAMIIPIPPAEPLCLLSEKWGIPVLSLSTYLRFWSIICFTVTIWLTFFQKEVGTHLDDFLSLIGLTLHYFSGRRSSRGKTRASQAYTRLSGAS